MRQFKKKMTKVRIYAFIQLDESNKQAGDNRR